MGERPIGVTDVPSGAGVAQFRTRERTVGGESVVEQYLIPETERVESFKGCVSNFRNPGAAAVYNLCSLFNKTGSGVLVAVHRLTLQTDVITATTGTVKTVVVSRLTTAPTTGTLMTPTAFDTTMTHSSSVEYRGASSADGTTSALTATPTQQAWTHFLDRDPSASSIEQHRFLDHTQVPNLAAGDPIILREGEGILLSVTAATATAIQHIVDCVFSEYALP